MKLRISIITVGVALLMNTGCSTVKTAYNGHEDSHFTNPAKIAAMTNGQQNGLAPIAEGPSADAVEDSSGWTGTAHETGLSTQPQFQPAAAPANSTPAGSWGGALSTR